MKRNLKCGLLIVGLAVSVIASSAFISAENGKSDTFTEDESKIADCLLNGEEAFEKIGVISEDVVSDTIDETKNTIAVLNENQKEEISTDLNHDFERYFTENLSSSYSEKNESSMDYYADIAETQSMNSSFSVAVRSGVLDFALTDVNISGDTAEAGSSFVGWHLWIERAETGAGRKYLLSMTMSHYDNTYTLIKNGDDWQISAIGERQQEFAPDSFDYEKGTFDTYEEALAAAEKIVPEEENPF